MLRVWLRAHGREVVHTWLSNVVVLQLMRVVHAIVSLHVVVIRSVMVGLHRQTMSLELLMRHALHRQRKLVEMLRLGGLYMLCGEL